MSKRAICESGLSWILNYRLAVKSKRDLAKIAGRDGHSGGSWAWTKHQSKTIDERGWDEWFNKTEGPLGYGPYFGKFMDNFLGGKGENGAGSHK
jgi:hypothetical protein